MPEHATFVTYLLKLFPALRNNAHNLGTLILSKKSVEGHHIDASATSLLVMMFIIGLAYMARGPLVNIKESVVPETKLSLRTFLELFLGFFYGLAKDAMGPERAKKYFPVVGTSALFVFFSNVLGLIPGMSPPTSSLNITFGTALLVFVLFNYYGIKKNGSAYFKHLFGPWLGLPGIPVNILIFVVELLSLCVRPITLAVRLMINMAVDHLIAGIFMGLVAVLLPIPTMILGMIVIVVQTIVFCLLTSVYIALATEELDHAHLGKE
jgi:F-type H+-transporting ATPase subunit a